jgi:phosphatidylinositol 3-kinase
MVNFKEPLPLPINPNIYLTGIIPEKCSVFASAMRPILAVFHCQDKQGNKKDPMYIMYKVGDDVRQDQLVLQVIKEMDKILKRIDYNFLFTCYGAWAGSTDDGIIEFVPNSKTIQEINQTKGMHDYIRKHEN